MIHIIDNQGYYIGFSGNNYEFKEGESGAPIPPNSLFLKPRWNNVEWIEGASAEELSIHNDFLRGEKIKATYEQRKADGWNAYQDFRADMVKEIYDQVITKPQAFIIEDFLSQGYDKIAQQGDWETAHYKLSQIILPEQYSFVQSYLDKAKAIMLNYIQINYKPM